MADNNKKETPDTTPEQQATESEATDVVVEEAGTDEATTEEATTQEATTEEATTEEATTEEATTEAPAADEAADSASEEALVTDTENADDETGETPAESPAEGDEAKAVTSTEETAETATEESAAAETGDAGDDSGSEPAADGSTDGQAADEDTIHVEEMAANVTTAPGMIGYTGEITGDVYTLADLEAAETGEELDETVDMTDLANLVEGTLTDVTEQEIVSGTVIAIQEKDVVIDIGFKSDGIVSRSEFDKELEVGDEVEVFLERMEDYHGQLVLSKTKADTVRRWNRIEEAYENEEVLEGTIIRRIKGGMIVELFDTMEAFLPGSQIDVRPVRDFDAYLEKTMEFKIVKLNPANENIVVSHKALIEKDLKAQREKILSTMEPGQILEGIVKNITDFGVFIDLGGVDGLLHITDLSWGRVSHPSELVSLDEKLNIVVLDYDKERQRISLGLKQLQPHPWENIEEKFTEGDVVEGKVVSITDYGAFVELEKGIEGLVHISEMSWTEHIRHPSQMVSLGQLVNVKILNIDSEGKKISLGMKQLEPDPWDNIAERYPAGTVMRGKVRNITNFGVFVEIEPGIDGLVHISDLSWTKRVQHPSEMIKKGQDLDVVVLNIDTKERRISLGHKQVETNPWNQFAQVYAEGSETEATVVRVKDKGIVVELPLEVEAFMPASEIARDKRLEDYAEGDKVEDLVVIRFDANQKEIIVSAQAAERAEEMASRQTEKHERRVKAQREAQEVQQFQEKDSSGSGPATLGELSGLAELKAQMEEAEAEDVKESAKAEAKAEAEAEAETETEKEAEKEAEAESSTEPDEAVEAESSDEAEEATDESEESEEADDAEEEDAEAEASDEAAEAGEDDEDEDDEDDDEEADEEEEKK